MKSETIAAIATAISNAGLGIIRVSGEDSISIINNIYRSKTGKKKLKDFQSHTIHYGFIADGNDIIDEVMVSVMKAPHSYTTEDTVEINCHGGILVLNKVLQAVIQNGARIAQPGEFTKRAFLNGRIDLSKAEAVMEMIDSKNYLALKSSINQLRGFLLEKVKYLRENIIYEIAFIESALDDPEHISLEGYHDKLRDKTEFLINELNRLLASTENGKVIKEGIETVIVGKPNAGKSSLLNLLLGEEKAIVTDIAGTTRDALEEMIQLDGIGLHIIDTAGIRLTEDIVEKIGVERAKKFAAGGDLILYVVDASLPLDLSDYEIMELLKGKKFLVLLNKLDLRPVISEKFLIKELGKFGLWDNMVDKEKYIIPTSVKEGIGIDQFKNMIKNMFFHGDISFNDEIIITNQRHKDAIFKAMESMKMVQKSLEDNMPEDFYSIDLMSAYSHLGEVIGEEVGEDLVNEIFSKFCMGK